MQLNTLLHALLPQDELVNINFDNVQVTSVTCDSREVKDGALFFALPGTSEHGNRYIAKAQELGAALCITNITPNFAVEGPILVTEHVRSLYAKACARFYAPQPAHAVAVTGTNGKTSVVNFIQQFWQMAGLEGAALGTVGIKTARGLQEGTLTSPEPGRLHQTLQQLKLDNVDYIALEASSHGMDQRRLEGVCIGVAGFTNFSRDHLDYHPTEQAYFEAKLRLFSQSLIDDGTAVVHMDDARSAQVVEACKKRDLKIFEVGQNGQHIRLVKAEPTSTGQRAEIVWQDADGAKTHVIDVPLMGRFQLDNVLIAMAMAEASGVAQESLIGSLPHLQGVKGRLELVADAQGAAIFVDYAHTPEALENALAHLKPHTSGKLIVVFGAGGDRDKGKRALMGRAAQDGADVVIVTDDNPRTEDPAVIRQEVLMSVKDGAEIADRALAIAQAIDTAASGDVVLIAGKGHEDYQILGTQKTYFSDHDEILRHKKVQPSG